MHTWKMNRFVLNTLMLHCFVGCPNVTEMKRKIKARMKRHQTKWREKKRKKKHKIEMINRLHELTEEKKKTRNTVRPFFMLKKCRKKQNIFCRNILDLCAEILSSRFSMCAWSVSCQLCCCCRRWFTHFVWIAMCKRRQQNMHLDGC